MQCPTCKLPASKAVTATAAGSASGSAESLSADRGSLASCLERVVLPRLHVLQMVTRDASPVAGSAAHCAPNVAATFQLVFSLGKSEQGRQKLSAAFSTCSALQEGQAMDLAYWIQVLVFSLPLMQAADGM